MLDSCGSFVTINPNLSSFGNSTFQYNPNGEWIISGFNNPDYKALFEQAYGELNNINLATINYQYTLGQSIYSLSAINDKLLPGIIKFFDSIMSSKTMTVNNIVFNPNQIINDKTLVIRDTSYLKSLFVTNSINNNLCKYCYKYRRNILLSAERME